MRKSSRGREEIPDDAVAVEAVSADIMTAGKRFVRRSGGRA